MLTSKDIWETFITFPSEPLGYYLDNTSLLFILVVKYEQSLQTKLVCLNLRLILFLSVYFLFSSLGISVFIKVILHTNKNNDNTSDHVLPLPD